MSAPRRYRWALSALPAKLRRARREELLSMLGEADAAERDGRPSGREAVALLAYGLRARAAAATLPTAAALVLASALAPMASWAERVVAFDDGGRGVGPDGPALWLLAALTVVALSTLPGRTRLLAALLVPFAFVVARSPGSDTLVVRFAADLPGVLASGIALAALAAGLARLVSVRLRAALLAAGALVAVAVTLPRPDLGDPGVRYAEAWTADLGLAVGLALAGALLGALAALWGAVPASDAGRDVRRTLGPRTRRATWIGPRRQE